MHSRYTLNIKGVAFKTVWVEYPDVEAVCKEIGASPTGIRNNAPLYTLPAIYDPNHNIAVADSAAIARYLDRTYPRVGPTLIPHEIDALHTAFQDAFASTGFPRHLARLIMASICAILNPRGEEYFRRTREEMFGSLEALAPAESEKRAEHWEGAEKAFGTIARWFATEPHGEEMLFFMGHDKICFADITLAAFLKGMQKLVSVDEWARVMQWNGGRWARFMDAFKPYEGDSGN